MLLEVRRRDLLVVLEGAIAAADHRLGDHHPGVVVAEDAGVLLVARRIRADLAELDVIRRERGVVEHDAVRQSSRSFTESSAFLARPSSIADAGHDAEALRLDEDLAPPRSPCCRPCCRRSRRRGGTTRRPTRAGGRPRSSSRTRARLLGLVGEAELVGEVGVVGRHADEHAGDEDRLRRAALAVAGGLEGLVRGLREAVEVQAVVPVGAADERQRRGGRGC